MYYKNDYLVSSLHKNEKGLGKGVIDNVWYKYKITDYNKPIVITFAPCELKFHSLSDVENKKFEDLKAWGFDFITKEGLNVISFVPLSGGQWYRSKDFAKYLTQLSEKISRFPFRFGYGGSMGGYGVSVFSNLLHLDRVLLLNPFSTLNRRLAPFETRFSKTVLRDNWESGFFNGAECNAEGYVIYDPLFNLDAKQAKRYKNLKHLRLPGVGHSIPLHLQKLGMLGWIAKSFLHENHIDENRFYREARKRREYSGYYNGILSDRNVHLTPKRKEVIVKYKYCLFVDDILFNLNPKQQDFIRRVSKNNRVVNMLISAKDANTFLLRFSKFIAKKGRYSIAIKIAKYLVDEEYQIEKTKELVSSYRKMLRQEKEKKRQII